MHQRSVFFFGHLAGTRPISPVFEWIGAPNERASFRFHDAIAVFAVPCLTTRIADPGFGGVFMNSA